MRGVEEGKEPVGIVQAVAHRPDVGNLKAQVGVMRLVFLPRIARISRMSSLQKLTAKNAKVFINIALRTLRSLR